MKRRGVVLAGGKGTRLLPTTKYINKHLLPVYDEMEGAIPIIDFPINTLISMGVEEILIITSREHCGKIVEYLGDGYDKGVTFTYKIQEMNDPERPPGIASALKLCEDFTGYDPFVVILGDNYFEWNDKFKKFYEFFIEDNNRFNIYNDCASKCGLFFYQTKFWRKYGIAEIKDSNIVRIVEKPKNYISDYAVTGMYMYTSDVYQVAKTLKPSKRGELEITDINNHYVNENDIDYTLFETYWGDCGTPETMIEVQKFLNDD